MACVVNSCKVSKIYNPEKRRIYRFPIDPERYFSIFFLSTTENLHSFFFYCRKRLWCHTIGRPDLLDYGSLRDPKICEHHFTADQFSNFLRTKFKTDAKPSENLANNLSLYNNNPESIHSMGEKIGEGEVLIEVNFMNNVISISNIYLFQLCRLLTKDSPPKAHKRLCN